MEGAACTVIGTPLAAHNTLRVPRRLLDHDSRIGRPGRALRGEPRPHATTEPAASVQQPEEEQWHGRQT
ncbi:hypothetical protein NDU88_006348 [Pleurodeles waltl]|uniref:Uncharacterized protein n=1 Tax=Pleurodeles waltl TaxID=8319 RepID=A0AAV7N3S7_PLEWA|nr:hypothetical protein NDU88_006348 [Pleurodeles waltl]